MTAISEGAVSSRAVRTQERRIAETLIPSVSITWWPAGVDSGVSWGQWRSTGVTEVRRCQKRSIRVSKDNRGSRGQMRSVGVNIS